MAQGLITNTYLENIADAIRFKSGGSDTYTPANMADAINNIPTGVEVPPLVVNNSSTLYSCYFAAGLVKWFNYPVTIPDGVTDIHEMFSEYEIFNQPVIMPDSITNCKFTFALCESFNSPVTLGNNVVDAYGLFQFDNNFNQPITLPESLVNAGTMFMGCINFNHPITIPKNVTSIYGMFYNCKKYRVNSFDIPYNVTNASRLFDSAGLQLGIKDVYIHRNSGTMNVCKMLTGAGRTSSASNRTNVYCNNLSMINGATAGQANSLLSTAITWTAMENGYYNDAASINLYLYNNIFYETSSSLYAKYQGNASLDAVIRMSDVVTNCAQMLNSCSNFNSSVQIGENVTSIVGMFNCCYNFNAPVIIGNNVQDMGAAFRNCNNFNQPIIVPNTATNCRTMLQGTSYNHPLTIPDKVTNCKWMLFNVCDFNQPLVIGNNVVDCVQMVEAYYWDDSTQTDHFEGGTFNQPIIFPKSVATANYALAGQQYMKADIVLHNNACSYSWFLGNSHYEGNIYCPNGIWASKITNIFAQKNNTSGIASIYTPQSYSDYNSAIRSYRPTGNSDTWIGDETNELVYSPTANIYIYCNWNGSIPGYSHLNYYSKDGLTMLHSEEYWDGFNGRWSYGSDEWSDEPNGSPVINIRNNIIEDTNIYYAGASYLTYTWSAQDSSPVSRTYDFVTNQGKPINVASVNFYGNNCWNMGTINVFVTDNGGSEVQLTNGTDYKVVWSGSNSGNANYILTANFDNRLLDSIRINYISVYRVNSSMNIGTYDNL